MANTALTSVQFHGASLFVTTINGVPHVAMRQICEAIGLQWEGQLQRIKRHAVLSTCVCVTHMQIPGDDQSREVVCLPLDKLNGWLFGVSVNRVRPELREKLTQYQAECFDVLANHFGAAVNPPVAAPAQKAIPMPQKRFIKSRDDLSFTKRDPQRRMNNWAISEKDRNLNCADGMELGRHFFLEIVELAKIKPEEALDAIQYALQGQEFNHGGSGFTNEGWGVEMGFVQAVAQYAVQGVKLEAEQRKTLGALHLA